MNSIQKQTKTIEEHYRSISLRTHICKSPQQNTALVEDTRIEQQSRAEARNRHSHIWLTDVFLTKVPK